MILYKYHGCGNDFLITSFDENIDYSLYAKKICHRKLGIGADGLIVDEYPKMHFYNQDGSKASMCGNGIRCYVRYLYEVLHIEEEQYVINVKDCKYLCKILDYTTFNMSVNLNQPKFSKNVMQTVNEDFEKNFYYQNKKITLYNIFLSTMHVVIFVTTFHHLDENLARFISNNPYYKNGCNVNFVKIINDKELQVVTYEKGVGFTKACGSGVASSFVVCQKLGLCGKHITCHLELGVLEVYENNDIYLIGNSHFLYQMKVEEQDGLC